MTASSSSRGAGLDEVTDESVMTYASALLLSSVFRVHAQRPAAMRPRTPREGRTPFALDSAWAPTIGSLILCNNVNRPQSLWPVRKSMSWLSKAS